MKNRLNPEAQILFVDDEAGVLDGIRRLLRSCDQPWQLHFASDVSTARRCLERVRMDVVVCDVSMPLHDGFVLLEHIKSQEEFKRIPLVMLTGISDAKLKRRALELGAMDLLTKPVMLEDLMARLQNVLHLKRCQDELHAMNVGLEQRVRERTALVEYSRREILLRLARAGEFRDSQTGLHVERVAHFSRLLAEGVGLGVDQCESIFLASPLHDIGKIGVPDAILLKTGPLTSTERLMMESHSRIGYKILKTGHGQDNPNLLNEQVGGVSGPDGSIAPANPLLETAAVIALAHHERWDGTGYPQRIAGQIIPIEARIVALADVYDALSHERPYKPAYPEVHVAELIKTEVGRHFDPEVVAAFDKAREAFRSVLRLFADRTPPSDDKLRSARPQAGDSKSELVA